MERDVTDEQRSRRPIFIATLWAGASWLFFRVARSTRMIQIWALYRQSGSDRLEKQPTDLRRRHHYMRDGALAHQSRMRPRRLATLIASVRLRTFNFLNIPRRCDFTVVSLM